MRVAGSHSGLRSLRTPAEQLLRSLDQDLLAGFCLNVLAGIPEEKINAWKAVNLALDEAYADPQSPVPGRVDAVRDSSMIFSRTERRYSERRARHGRTSHRGADPASVRGDHPRQGPREAPAIAAHAIPH